MIESVCSPRLIGLAARVFYFILFFIFWFSFPEKKNKNVWAVALIDSAPVGWPGGLAAR